jgi:hypothetical protein
MHTYTHVHIHIDKHHERLQQAKNKTIYVLMKTPPQKNKINRPSISQRSIQLGGKPVKSRANTTT